MVQQQSYLPLLDHSLFWTPQGNALCEKPFPAILSHSGSDMGYMHGLTEKKDGAKTVPFGNRFEKNGALFSKKGTKTVPLLQSAPHQKGTAFIALLPFCPFSVDPKVHAHLGLL